MFLYSVSVAGFIVADFPFYNVDDNSLILSVVVVVNIINHQAPNPSSPRNDKSPQMLGISRAFTRNCNKANIISSIMCAVSGARRELAGYNIERSDICCLCWPEHVRPYGVSPGFLTTPFYNFVYGHKVVYSKTMRTLG